VIEGTRARYVEAYEQVSGRSFDTWYGEDEWAERPWAGCPGEQRGGRRGTRSAARRRAV